MTDETYVCPNCGHVTSEEQCPDCGCYVLD